MPNKLGNRRFILALWVGLFLAYATSGDRFLNWAFEMPDIGGIDDAVIAVLFFIDDSRQAMQVEDIFGFLRSFLHRIGGFAYGG